MSNYFNYFPKTPYFLTEGTLSADVITDITARFGFEPSFKNNTAIYYEYDIQDGDTPEIIAAKMYDSPERHWAVLMLNDIVDAQYDWPLDQRSLIRFIDSKYSVNADTANGQSGLEWSQANIKEYYKIVTKTDLRTNTVVIEKFQSDANTYANVTVETSNTTLADGSSVSQVVTKEQKTYYTYELETNEKLKEYTDKGYYDSGTWNFGNLDDDYHYRKFIRQYYQIHLSEETKHNFERQ